MNSRGILQLLLVFGGLQPILWADTLRDPTQPLRHSTAASAPAKQRLRLESILISGQRRVAVINGESVMVDDMVDGARVLRIAPGIVEISHGGKRLKLQMHSDIRTDNKTRKSRVTQS